MPETLSSVRTDVLYRLGDSNESVWTDTEVDSYIVEGYNLFVRSTRCLWDWEYTNDVGGQGTYALPSDLLVIDRVTYDGKKIDALTDRELRGLDQRYMTTEGEPLAYSVRQDGIGYIRFYPIPSSPDAYSVTGTWGIPRSLDDLDQTVTGTWGIPRTVPIDSESASTDPAWGIPRFVSVSAQLAKIEYYQRGSALVADDDEFDIPAWTVKYVRLFAMARCLERRGPGQDMKLAKHFHERFSVGVDRLIKRRDKIKSARVGRFGGMGTTRSPRPRARLPWQYGTVVR